MRTRLTPFIALCWLTACGDGQALHPCEGADPYLYVDARAHVLWACEHAQPVQRYGVRLGVGGLDKKEEGDRKTPLGTYALEAPRPSAKYGTFIGLGYPTEAQRAQGYTGSAVGVHGPDRRYRWLGGANNWLDTTDGCVGLATDAEMDQLARWVEAAHARKIVLEWRATPRR